MNNFATTDKQGLRDGVVIIKHLIDEQINYYENGEGPFNSLRAIKKYSSIFKSIQSTSSKRAQQIFEEKNIICPSDFIRVDPNQTFEREYVDLFTHILLGRVKNGEVTGIHFYNPEIVKILEEIKHNSEYETWSARIEFYNRKTAKWIEKRKPSSFFPRHWDITRLFHECYFAYRTMEKKEGSEFLYMSTTESNVEVEIISKNGVLKSIYPIV